MQLYQQTVLWRGKISARCLVFLLFAFLFNSKDLHASKRLQLLYQKQQLVISTYLCISLLPVTAKGQVKVDLGKIKY